MNRKTRFTKLHLISCRFVNFVNIFFELLGKQETVSAQCAPIAIQPFYFVVWAAGDFLMVNVKWIRRDFYFAENVKEGLPGLNGDIAIFPIEISR